MNEAKPAPKTLIICTSVHHHGTARVARTMAEVLDAAVVVPEEVPATSLDEHDLVGFGSGVYFGRFHPRLWQWLQSLPDAAARTRAAFIFSTSGLSFLWKAWHAPFLRALERKGFDVVGEFHCRGHDSWGPLWLAGGINRGHPDARDLARAADFARHMKDGFMPKR